MSNSEHRQVGRFAGLSRDYLQLRDRVTANAKQMNNVSPCQKGMAHCCEGHVEVSLEEGQAIIDAAKKGKIPDGVLDRVRENLADESTDTCVFLGKNRSCMIYDRRPLECVSFGRGALIVTEEGREQFKAIGEGDRVMEYKSQMLCHDSVGIVEYSGIPMFRTPMTYLLVLSQRLDIISYSR